MTDDGQALSQMIMEKQRLEKMWREKEMNYEKKIAELNEKNFESQSMMMNV